MIETLELCKTYAKGRIVANDRISLRVEDGKIFCLLGLNGARKTTLIKIFATPHIRDGESQMSVRQSAFLPDGSGLSITV
jgi:ABC-type Na+ transport system ATPase subunit NatA